MCPRPITIFRRPRSFRKHHATRFAPLEVTLDPDTGIVELAADIPFSSCRVGTLGIELFLVCTSRFSRCAFRPFNRLFIYPPILFFSLLYIQCFTLLLARICRFAVIMSLCQTLTLRLRHPLFYTLRQLPLRDLRRMRSFLSVLSLCLGQVDTKMNYSLSSLEQGLTENPARILKGLRLSKSLSQSLAQAATCLRNNLPQGDRWSGRVPGTQSPRTIESPQTLRTTGTHENKLGEDLDN